jgi:hypothetical protein
MKRVWFFAKRWPIPIIAVAIHTAMLIWSQLPWDYHRPTLADNLVFLFFLIADWPCHLLVIFDAVPEGVVHLFGGSGFYAIFGTSQWIIIGVSVQLWVNFRGRRPPADDNKKSSTRNTRPAHEGSLGKTGCALLLPEEAIKGFGERKTPGT